MAKEVMCFAKEAFCGSLKKTCKQMCYVPHQRCCRRLAAEYAKVEPELLRARDWIGTQLGRSCFAQICTSIAKEQVVAVDLV